MATYHWQGIDIHGKRKTGVNSLANRAELIIELQKQGITPLRIRVSLWNQLNWRLERIKAVHIQDFTQQLAALHHAGIALVPALHIIGDNHDCIALRNLLAEVRRLVESGTAFSDALRKYPKYFDAFYCDLIHAGEQSGTLASMLQQIVIHQDKMASLRRKITKALIYPVLVMGIAICVTAALLGLVIPRFATLFAGFGADLPYYTRVVIHLANVVRMYGLKVIIGVGILLAAYYLLWRQFKPVRDYLDQLKLKFPVYKNLLKKTIWARFARTLATTYQAGVPLSEALPLIANIVGNSVFQRAVKEIQQQVTAGIALHIAAQHTQAFPPRLVQILAIGEESGSLATLLEKVAVLFEQDVDNFVENLSKLLEPAIMLILGTIIGGLIAAMYLPIFRIGAII